MIKIALLLTFAALLAGCGSGSDSSEVQAEKAANEKAGPVPPGLEPTEVASGRRPAPGGG